MITSTDPIADYLTRLRNAIQARHKKVDVPASNIKRALSKILLENKYITGFTEMEDGKQGILRIALKYADGRNAITNMKRISTPGLRRYSNVTELPRVLNGLGVVVVSTSKGLMTDKQAREQRVGGEILCSIW